LEEKQKTKEKLDSLVTLIRTDSIKFDKAAMLFSMDEETRMNGGQLVNPNTGNTKFELDQFDTKDYIVINKLSVGLISDPYESVDTKGKTIFKVVRLKSRSNPHVANLKDDYTLFKQITMQQKENEIIENWIKEKIKTTYIIIDDKYKNCDYNIKAWIK
jgi:peptidyl-prolyl cis-trans isomerase SurA